MMTKPSIIYSVHLQPGKDLVFLEVISTCVELHLKSDIVYDYGLWQIQLQRHELNFYFIDSQERGFFKGAIVMLRHSKTD